MAQLKKVTQKFQDPAYAGKRDTTGTARLLHVNEVISWIRVEALKENHADNAAAKTAGLVAGDLYHTDGLLKIVINV
jgi:hypothetical protein